MESIAADPVNPQKVWVAAGEYTSPSAGNGRLLRSANQGRTWQITDLPIELASNQDGRDMGERLAVDPRDDRILYLASPANGLWRSTDGGVAWSQVTSFPVTSSPDDIGLSFVTFDPAVPAAARRHDRWFPVDDIYRSTDGGVTWKSVSATASLDVSASPFLHWGAAPKFGWWIASVAIDPFSSAHVIYGTGATVFGSADVTAMDSGGGTHWSSAAADGIEETAVQDLLSPPDGPGHLVSAVGDLGGFYHDTLSASPAEGMSSNPILSTGTSLAGAGFVPADVVRVGWSGGAWSSDDGRTWTPMTLPAGEPNGAGVAALSADAATVLWAPEHYSWAPEPGRHLTVRAGGYLLSCLPAPCPGRAGGLASEALRARPSRTAGMVPGRCQAPSQPGGATPVRCRPGRRYLR